MCQQKCWRSSKFVTWGHTTRVIFRMKICIFERSNEKNHFSKTKIYFHKKTAPQLLGHIRLQNMKVGEKTNLGDLPLFVWCMLTLALNWLLILCLCIPPILRREKIFILQLGNMLSWCLQPFSITFFSGQDDLKEQLFKKHQSSYSCYGYRKKSN